MFSMFVLSQINYRNVALTELPVIAIAPQWHDINTVACKYSVLDLKNYITQTMWL